MRASNRLTFGTCVSSVAVCFILATAHDTGAKLPAGIQLENAAVQGELEQLLQVLEQGSDAEKIEAARSLALLGPEAERAVDPLLNTLESDNLRLSTLSALALGSIGPAADKGIKPIITRVELVPDKPGYGEVMMRYGEALGMFGESAVPDLVEGIRSEIMPVFVTCAEALHAIGPPSHPAFPRAHELLKSDDPKMTWTGAYLCEAIGAPAAEATPELIPMLDSEDFHQQVVALRALAAFGESGKAAAPRVMELIDEGNLSVRSAAALAIGAMGALEGIDSAKKLRDLTDDRLDLMRERALLGLAALGPAAGPESTTLLRKLSDDTEYPNRPYAAFAYAKVSEDYDYAVDLLLTLSEEDMSTLVSIPLLGKLGEKAAPAVPRLSERLASPDPDIGFEVLAALKAIGEPAKAALPEIRKITMHEDAELAAFARRLERELSKD